MIRFVKEFMGLVFSIINDKDLCLDKNFIFKIFDNFVKVIIRKLYCSIKNLIMFFIF